MATSMALVRNSPKQIEKTAVAVVDDDPDALLFLQDILREAENLRCVGCFSNAVDALKGIPPLRPSLVLMDINLPDLNGIECTKQLKCLVPEVKIVILSALYDNNWVERSLKAGANAYLVKPVTPDQCLATLNYAAVGKIVEGAKQNPISPAMRTLTSREREVMQFLAKGLLYKEISAELGISYSAVHKYQHQIFQKFRASNRSEAIRIWLEIGGE